MEAFVLCPLLEDQGCITESLSIWVPVDRNVFVSGRNESVDLRVTCVLPVCYLSVIVLSHWPHVAEQVAQQVAHLVASVKGLGHKLPNLLLNLCPSPFTLATCAATSCVLRRPRLYLDVKKGVHYVVESHGYSLSLQPSSSSEQNMTSLGIPFSDWLNENVLKMCRNLLLNMCPV